MAVAVVTGSPSTVARLYAFLRSFVGEVPEPSGLGAVARAGNGRLYVRSKVTTTDRHWDLAGQMHIWL